VLKEQGLASTTKWFAKKPCDGYCTILKMSAGIEYDDGSEADTKTGVSIVQISIKTVYLLWYRLGSIMLSY
jgi:hypothetical protein